MNEIASVLICVKSCHSAIRTRVTYIIILEERVKINWGEVIEKLEFQPI